MFRCIRQINTVPRSSENVLGTIRKKIKDKVGEYLCLLIYNP